MLALGILIVRYIHSLGKNREASAFKTGLDM